MVILTSYFVVIFREVLELCCFFQGTALKLQQVSSIGLGIFNDAVPLLFRGTDTIFLKTTVGELLFSGVFVNCSFPANSFPAGAVCQGLRARAPPTYRRAGTDFYFSMFGHVSSDRTLPTAPGCFPDEP